MSFECLAFDISCEYHSGSKDRALRMYKQAVREFPNCETKIKSEFISHAWFSDSELKDFF